jgi:hypothetical protein
MRLYHFSIVVSIDDEGNIDAVHYDSEAPDPSSDGWIWNDETEEWENAWDTGADTSYALIQTMLSSANAVLESRR